VKKTLGPFTPSKPEADRFEGAVFDQRWYVQLLPKKQ
jgi:hypothetical protein